MEKVFLLMGCSKKLYNVLGVINIYNISEKKCEQNLKKIGDEIVEF